MSISKLQDTRLILEKWIAFLYASDVQLEFEVNTAPSTLAPKKIKYLGINLPKYVQDLYEDNYKTDERNWWRSK